MLWTEVGTASAEPQSPVAAGSWTTVAPPLLPPPLPPPLPPFLPPPLPLPLEDPDEFPLFVSSPPLLLAVDWPGPSSWPLVQSISNATDTPRRIAPSIARGSAVFARAT